MFVMGGVQFQQSHLPPSNKGQKFPGELHPGMQHSTGDSAPFPPWGLQLSPGMIPKLMSADWMRKPATTASAQSIYLETGLPCLVVKLPGYHVHAFSSAAVCVRGIPPVGIQKSMSLSTSVPHLTISYLLQWCSADISDCLADKCFILPTCHCPDFVFHLQTSRGFLGKLSCLAW